jgi:hypothetical protein
MSQDLAELALPSLLGVLLFLTIADRAPSLPIVSLGVVRPDSCLLIPMEPIQDAALALHAAQAPKMPCGGVSRGLTARGARWHGDKWSWGCDMPVTLFDYFIIEPAL